MFISRLPWKRNYQSPTHLFRRAFYKDVEQREYQARKHLGLQRFDKTVESRRELRNQYYKLAKQCHPDIAEEQHKDAARFALLSEAYSILTEGFENKTNYQRSSRDRSSGEIWARMFFGSIECEMAVSDDMLTDIIHAASLSRGGLDKGGMWALVENFAAVNRAFCQPNAAGGDSNISVPPDGALNWNVDHLKQSQSMPKPFSRKKQ